MIVGSGAFGNVYKGTIFDETKGKTITVAIKTLKERNAKIEFFKEALAVARLRHENIIQFLGRCRTQRQNKKGIDCQQKKGGKISKFEFLLV